MVKKERLIEFVFLGNLYWAVQPTGFLERYCQSFLRFNWVNKVEKEVTPFFHFEKNVLRFLFTGRFCNVMQDLTESTVRFWQNYRRRTYQSLTRKVLGNHLTK